MAIIPVLVLFLGAISMWAMRSRNARIGWSLGTAAAGLAWLSSLLITRSLPIQTSLSVWRPIELFETQVELAVDTVIAKVFIAGTTVIFSVVLSKAIKLTDKEYRLRAIVLAYGAIALMAMLSSNLLTAAICWALLDSVTLLNELSLVKDKAATSHQINRLVLNVTGLFALIGVAIVRGVSGEIDDLGAPFSGYTATAILLVAVFMRIGLFSFGTGFEERPEDDAFGILAGVLPQAAAVVVLIRQLAFGIPEELILWIRLICLIGLFFGGIRFVFEEKSKERQRLFNLGMVFLGLFVSSAVPARADAPMASAIGAMILVGTLCGIIRIHSPWQRALPVLAALILIMPGWTIGALLVQGIATSLDIGPTLWIAILSIMGLALLSMGLIKDIFKSTRVWYVDDLARMLYALALFLPIAAGIGLGAQTGSGIEIRSIVVTFLTAGLAVGGLTLVRKMEDSMVQRMQNLPEGIRIGSSLDAGRKGLNWISKTLRLLGGILEGEGAMLWVFVILLMIQLVVGGGSG